MASNNPRLSGAQWTPDDPYVGAVAINYAGGDQVLTTYGRGIYVSTTGALKVDFVDGSTVTLSALPVGVYRFCVKKIYQTGSTAAGVVLL